MALKGNWVAYSYANDAAATTGYGGGTPASGSIYYNTTDSILKLWTGSAWAACGVDPPSKLEIETIDSSVGGLRLAWDFNNELCYDGTSAPSDNSALRFVKNLAADDVYGSSPQNSEARGGYWVTHPSYMINNSTSEDEAVFRPKRSTSYSSRIGSPYDTARNTTKQTADAADYGNNKYGATMCPWKGNATGYNSTDNSDSDYAGLGGARMIQSYHYPSNDSTYGSSGQNDSETAGTWVVFQKIHPLWPAEETCVMIGCGSQDNPNSGSGSSLCWAPADKGIVAISGMQHGNTESWDASDWALYGAQWGYACGDRDRTQNTYWQTPAWRGSDTEWTGSAAYPSSYIRDSDYTTGMGWNGTAYNLGNGRYTYSSGVNGQNYQHRSLPNTSNANNPHLTPTMWTYTSSETTPFAKLYFQDDAEDEGTQNNVRNIAHSGNLHTTWPYAEQDDHQRQTASHFDWTTFGRNSYRYSAPHHPQWNNRDDVNWLTSRSSFGSGYNTDHTASGCFHADFHVVLYFNKILSDSERTAIYNAYTSRFGLPAH